jgi:hypothetical protein
MYASSDCEGGFERYVLSVLETRGKTGRKDGGVRGILVGWGRGLACDGIPGDSTILRKEK